MKRYPAGAGCDDDPRRGWDRRRGDEAEGPVVVPFSCRRLNSPFGSLRRPETASDAPKRPLCLSLFDLGGDDFVISSDGSAGYIRLISRLGRPVDLASKAAETLRSASGGVPVASGEAAAMSERSERERVAVRSRGGRGRGAESVGWRGVAEWCRATEGSGHE